MQFIIIVKLFRYSEGDLDVCCRALDNSDSVLGVKDRFGLLGGFCTMI